MVWEATYPVKELPRFKAEDAVAPEIGGDGVVGEVVNLAAIG
jgi:hypothetical protein